MTPTRLEDLIQSVCGRVLRDLTPDEQVQYVIRSETQTCTNLAE